MKKLLPVIFCLISVHLFAQSTFVIDGKTNTVLNGKAVIAMSAKELYPYKLTRDTVLIKNHSFVFTGTLKYAQEFRIQMFGKNGNNSLSEPFFMSAGYHKLVINKALDPHDRSEVGEGVSLQDPANDEYIKKFLPSYNRAYKEVDACNDAWVKCNSTKEKKTKKGCLLAIEAQRVTIKKDIDNVFLNYAKANPTSQIIPWLLYDRIFYRGYSNILEDTYKTFAVHTPENINTTIKDFLAKQKLKAPGYPFALTDFVKANTPKNVSQNKYILVDFWFSHCIPCIGQFDRLKSVYQKFHKKGFEVVAISVDKKEDIPRYKNLIAKNGYVWPQVLDLNGVKTKTLDLPGFPSAFLLDSNWKIVKMDLSTEALSSFLEDNLP